MKSEQQLTLAVSEERWRQAQEWEAAFWRSQNPAPAQTLTARAKRLVKRLLGRTSASPGDDWNHWWAEKFDGYRVLPQRMERAIELGCGPYTNIRLIAEGRQMNEVWCSDPLVEHYLTFEERWLGQAWRRGTVEVDDHPIEECPFESDSFDLVVMINVLDHVRDALECLRQAARIARPGGWLVVGQDLSNAEDVARTGEDAGHPIRIDDATLDAALLPEFEAVLHRVLTREEGRNPEAHYGTYLFLGRKKAEGHPA
ncbi:MAG: class I SAM-dependent methyltransferase [Acidobacteria bacterium]|nr:class I SAM-dependent methyltransferase [Acidobacteriota bacterium]